jgi:hypothetical protein
MILETETLAAFAQTVLAINGNTFGYLLIK